MTVAPGCAGVTAGRDPGVEFSVAHGDAGA